MEPGMIILLVFSICVTVAMMIFILSAKNKTQLHYIFLFAIMEALILVVFSFLQAYFAGVDPSGPLVKQMDYLAYIVTCTLPVLILLIGRVYAFSNIVISWKISLLFIIPAVTLFILFTDDPYHVFYVQYHFGSVGSEVLFGWYFYVHSLYSYACLAIGFTYLIFFSIKNTGILSKQAILTILGCALPVTVSILTTIGAAELNVYSKSIPMMAAVMLFMFAMFKFNLMKVTPVALKTVVNRISDSYVVVDEKLNIVDFNKSFLDNFAFFYVIKPNENLYNLLKIYLDTTELNADAVLRDVVLTKETNNIVKREINLKKDKDYNKYFEIEFTPVFANNQYVATIILMKDITQRKKDFDTIQENQAIMMEKERLVSLGQLVGGIAHNLKTPILSASGALEQMHLLVQEYDQSIEDPDVTFHDHHEIAGEMNASIKKMRAYIAYMSDVISTVKDQAVKLNSTIAGAFTLHELIHRVDILMKYELIRTNCTLLKEINVDDKITIKGDVNSLVQIFDNIIVNSIQAYNGKKGKIILRIWREGDSIVFSLKDFAGGLEKNVAESLFKKMVTTKGRNGTGIGLYISYSTIKGMFRGNMWFESKENEGTEFFVSIPMNVEGEVIHA